MTVKEYVTYLKAQAEDPVPVINTKPFGRLSQRLLPGSLLLRSNAARRRFWWQFPVAVKDVLGEHLTRHMVPHARSRALAVQPYKALFSNAYLLVEGIVHL